MLEVDIFFMLNSLRFLKKYQTEIDLKIFVDRFLSRKIRNFAFICFTLVIGKVFFYIEKKVNLI